VNVEAISGPATFEGEVFGSAWRSPNGYVGRLRGRMLGIRGLCLRDDGVPFIAK
jgi:hypothetical protein